MTYAGTRPPFTDGQFHSVASFQMIEHELDDQGFVAGAARVLAGPLLDLRMRLEPEPRGASWPHSVADFYATIEDRDGGCDLLAICRR